MTLKYFITHRHELRSKLQALPQTEYTHYLLKLLDVPVSKLIDAMTNTYMEKHCGFAPYKTKIRLPKSFIRFKTHDDFWHAMSDLSKTTIGQ